MGTSRFLLDLEDTGAFESKLFSANYPGIFAIGLPSFPLYEVQDYSP